MLIINDHTPNIPNMYCCLFGVWMNTADIFLLVLLGQPQPRKKKKKTLQEEAREYMLLFWMVFFFYNPKQQKCSKKKNIEIYAIRTYIQYTHGFCYPSSLSDNSFFFWEQSILFASLYCVLLDHCVVVTRESWWFFFLVTNWLKRETNNNNRKWMNSFQFNSSRSLIFPPRYPPILQKNSIQKFFLRFFFFVRLFA